MKKASRSAPLTGFSLLRRTILVIFLAASGCTNTDHADILTPEQLASAYVELLACAMDSSRRDTSLVPADVLLNSGIDSLTLQQTLAHYRENPELWLDFISKVNEQLERRDKEKTQEKLKNDKSTPVSE